MYQDNERNPAVRNYVNNLPGSRDNPESIANFYSPLDSPQGMEYFSNLTLGMECCFIEST